ncbi:MAG: tetratricopeptide repeat protein [Bacteroidetes bacterium]|nr:tetratricopeptide repeat protein [Bacteroidota bacterium]
MTTKKTSAKELVQEAQTHISAQRYDEAMELLRRVEQLPDDRVDTHTRMRSLSYTGMAYTGQGDHKTALRYLLQALDLASRLGDLRAMHLRYENLSTVYMELKEHEKALSALQQSLDIKEKNGDEADMPRALLMLSTLQFHIDNTDAAAKALQRASHILRRLAVTDMDHWIHFNTGMLLRRQGKPEAAMRSYSKCIKAALLRHDFVTAARASNNQGDICMGMQQWVRARRYFERCILYGQKVDSKYFINTSTLQLALIALRQNNLALSRRLYDDITPRITEANDVLLLRDHAELGMLLYQAEGDYQAAVEASHVYIRYYKLYYDDQMSRAVLDMQGKYEAERSERELQKARLKQAESELKALRAQMDPHFIFNALSSMRREMLEGNIENADRYLVRFSRLLRMILDTTRQPMVRLSDNIELLHLYIQIENSRQGNRFDYSITTRGIDPATVSLPGLILQPLAENAIVHGLNPKKNGRGKLDITFARSGSALKIRVTDNGVGRQAGKNKTEGHTSHAMNIIRETLDLMWQDKSRKDYMTIRDIKTNNNIGRGTEVTILVPLSA